MVDKKVGRTIEALPFTAEGYNRAKSILQERFGKEHEIIKAYAKEILVLLTVTSANPNKINEFSAKLRYCVKALQTLGKLEQVNGAVSMKLKKLLEIRGGPCAYGSGMGKVGFFEALRGNSVEEKPVQQ